MLKRPSFTTFFLLGASILVSTSCSNSEKSIGPTFTTETTFSDVHIPAKKFILPNGLRLIVSENHRLPLISYYTFFDVGGRHEKPGTTGATHFLEHMMFKGSKNFGPGKFDGYIEKMGGHTNAYTSFDETVYYENLPSKGWKKIVEMEADRLKDILLIPFAFESERKVILEERKMRYENRPFGQLMLATLQTTYKGTPYGGSVIGSKEDLLALKRDEVKNFYKQFYTPDNAVVVIVGDVNADEVFREVSKRYGELRPGTKEIIDYRKTVNDKKIYTTKNKFGEVKKLKGASPSLIFNLVYPGVPAGEKRGYALDILSSMIGSGASSHLHQSFVTSEKPRLSSISAGHYQLKYNGLFYINGTVLNKMSPKGLEKDIIDQIAHFCKNKITERSIQKIKNQYLVGVFEGLSTNAGAAQFLGDYELTYNDYSVYKKDLASYEAITPFDVKQECKSLLSTQKPHFISVWNKNK